MVLLWSGTSRRKKNHKGTSSERCVPAGYVATWSEDVFVTKKVKNTVSWTYIVSDLKGEKIAGRFHEKELQKTNENEFRIEKVIKRKRLKVKYLVLLT